MPLPSGTRLDTYEILSSLGAGGMGEVYRARDAKLNRDVAIKVLPAAVAGDAERLARFGREARALAALNHPNIAHVYDSGTSGVTSYLVMELVPGDDLSLLIARGPLPVAEALAIARQVAAALETAHEAGIVHRDLKPANIKVRSDGVAKVLDFGLAKATPDAKSSDFRNVVDSPTVTAASMPGVILGTAAYMSPEQARGNPVDRRSDVWAFGAVLYEMLTGRRAFDGGTTADVIGAVVRLDPDWTALPADVPPAIRALLQGCLEKDHARRIADISTARFVIDTASRFAAPPVIAPAPAPARRRSPVLATIAALLACLSVALLWVVFRPQHAAVARYTVTPLDDDAMVQAVGVDFALSPDATWMVYVGRTPGGSTRLLRRHLDDLAAVPVSGSDDAAAPAVSPDGRTIAFLANGAIRTIPVEGGQPFTVVTAGGEPAWSDDGAIYFGRSDLTYRVSAGGGEATPVSAPLPNILQRLPDVLPGGRGVLITLMSGTPAQAQIAVVDRAGATPRPILRGTMARYASTGHVVYSTSNGALMAVPFDLGRLEPAGPPVPIGEGVAVEMSATSQFAVSRSGAVLYGTGIGFLAELVWVGRDGVATPVDPSWTGEFSSPVLSPDGTRLALAIQKTQGSRDIWIAQLDRGPRLRLTLDGDRNDYPAWSHDGRLVTFASDRKSPSFDLWTRRSDGSGEPVLELDEEPAIAEAVWSPDGAWFVHRTSTNVTGRGDILGRRVDRDEKPVPLVASEFTELTPAISPNGKWLAYVSTESGRGEVFVVPFPNTGDSRWPVSVGGGSEPAWSRDGRELFYRSGKGEMVAVRVETEKAFSIGATTVLFPDTHFIRLSTHRQYDVARDRRFIMMRPIGAGRESRLILVRNALARTASGAAR